METRHSTLSKHVTKLRSARSRTNLHPRRIRPARHSSDESDETARMRAGRSIGKTQDGTSDSGDAPGADAAVDGFVGCLSGGRRPRAVMSCGGRFERRGAGVGQLCAPFVGTAANPSHATSRRGAHFTPGGHQDREIWRNGRRERTGMGKRNSCHMATVAMRQRCSARMAPRRPAQSCAGHAAGNRSGNDLPLAIHAPLRTPASSRSDRRPDARRRR